MSQKDNEFKKYKSSSYIPRGRRACLNIVDRNVQEIIYCYRKGQDVSRTKDCPRCRFY